MTDAQVCALCAVMLLCGWVGYELGKQGRKQMEVITEQEIELNGRRLDVKIHGECMRNFGSIHCEITKVLTPDGTDVYGAIAEEHMDSMRVRLKAQYIGDAHPGGHGEEAAV